MSQFKIRTTCPGKGAKNYIRKENGGWSICIKGKPTNKYCDVLANCVGYAIGRASEVYDEIKGTTGNYFNNLNTDAERIYALAKKKGYKVGKTPKPGALIVWRKGKTNDGSDGAGHVAFVEKVINKNTIYLSESGYGASYFWNSTRKNDNKNWGQSSAYTFLGFVYNPAIKDEVVIIKKKYPDLLPDLPKRGYFKYGDKGTEVRYLQRFLNWATDYGLDVDGVIGDKTIAAVKMFQRKVKLTPDGLFGKDTLKKAKSFKR